MLKKRIITSIIASLLLFTSSIGFADGFNYGTIKLNSSNNTYNVKVYSANNNTYQVSNGSNLWNLIIWNNNTVSRPGVVLPKPTNPAPTVPTNPVEQPKPVEPAKPAEPAKPVEPTKPLELVKPVIPEAPTQSYAGLSADEAEVVRLVNMERQKAGLAPLKASSQLSNVAREKSKDMATKNYFSHTSPTYGSPFDMMKQFGISYRTAGENIAKGYLNPASVMNGWMNSSGHRANILNGSFGTIGVGAYKVGSTIYWTQMFTN